MKFYLFIPVLFLYACNFNSGAPQSKTPKGTAIHVSGYTRVISDVSAEISIEVNADSTYTCYLECEKEIEPLLTFDIVNDELHISAKDDLHSNSPIRITMRVSELKSLTNNSSGNIVVNGTAKGTDFDIENTGSGSVKLKNLQSTQVLVQNHGSGTIELKGNTEKMQAKLLGSGGISAFDLKSNDAVVDITGSGNIEVTATNKLDASILGSGNIYYKGKPAIQNNITGSGMISAR